MPRLGIGDVSWPPIRLRNCGPSRDCSSFGPARMVKRHAVMRNSIARLYCRTTRRGGPTVRPPGSSRPSAESEAERILLAFRNLFETLTELEREIVGLVAQGRMNKQIAAEIGIAEITVKIHRGRIMQKMGAKSLAEPVKMAEVLGTEPAKTLRRET